MTTQDAAVRAVAEALPRLRFVAHPSDPCYSLMLDTDRAREVLAALATSADVRAGLVAAVHRESVGEWPLESAEGEATAWWVDAVLAALGGAG